MSARVKKRMTLIVGTLVVLSVSLAGAYAIKQARTKAQMAQWLRDGTAAYKAGDYQLTMEKLGKYAGRDQTDEKVILALADARRHTPMDDNKTHIREAIRFARKAAELAPDDPAPREMLLELYEEAGFLSERLQVAESILAKQPTHHNAMQVRVQCLGRLGRTTEAFAAAKAYADAYPEDLTAHRYVIELMTLEHEQPSKIRDYADQAAAKFSDNQQFVVMRARAHVMTGDAAGGLDLAKKAAEMPVKSAEAMQDMVLLLDQLSPVDPKLASLADEALDREMKGSLGLEIAAVAAERSWKTGRPDQARADAARAFDPATPSSGNDQVLGWWTFLGVASGKPLDDAQIKPALAELRSRKSEPATFWADLAEGAADLNAGKLKEASQNFTHARATGQRDDIADYLLGDVNQRLGEWRKAVSAWEKLAQEQPSWRVVHLALVTLLLQHGQIEQAVHHAEIAMNIRPGTVEAVALTRSLAMLLEAGYAKQDQVLKAIELAERLKQDAPNDALIQSLVARIFLAAGKPDKGVPIVSMLLGVTPSPSPDVLASLAAAVRPYDSALADQALTLARSSGDTPELAYQAACQLANTGKAEDGRALLQRALQTHTGADHLAYEIRLASFLDRIKDPGAASAFAKLSLEHESEPAVQLALLDSDAAWADEALIGAAVGRLQRIAGEGSIAWKINEARRLLVFNPGPARAAEAINRYLTPALQQEPGNVGALVLTAEAYALLGDRNKAVELLSKAVDADPDRPGLYPRLIELLQQSGASDEAGRRLMAFSKIPNLATDPLRKRARLLVAQGMWEQAADDFAKLDALGNPEDRFAYAVTLARRGQADLARQKLDAVLAAPKPSESLVISIADFYAGQGDIDKGRNVLDQHLPPDSSHRALSKAAFFERFGRFDDAEQQYVEQAKDGTPDSQAELAKFYYKRGRKDEAKAIVDRALAAAPGNAALTQINGFLKLNKGTSNKEALADIAASIDSTDASLPLKKMTAALQALEENPADAAGYMTRLETITKEHPTFFPAWRLLVEAKFQRGEVKEAIDLARVAARTAPIDPRPARLASEVMSAAGQYEEALVMAQQWRQRSITEPFEADMSIATINAAMKRFDDSMKRLEPWKSRIISSADTAPEFLQLLSLVLANLGRTDEAKGLLWPRAEKDPQWAIRCLTVAKDLSGPAQDQWLAFVQPLLEHSTAGQLALGQALYEMALKHPSPALFEKAVAALTAASEDSKFKGPAALYMAASYQNLGKKQDAARCYRLVLEANPNDASALNNLAYILAEDPGTAPEAATLAQRAVDLATTQNSPVSIRKSFIDTLGVSLLKCGRYADAEAAFGRGLALDDQALELLVGLAEARLAQGKDDKAKELIRQWDSRSYKTDDLERRVAVMRTKVQTLK
jgi:tetratricopeptide (TPR) repeat protein